MITFPEEVPSFLVSRVVEAVREGTREYGLIKEENVNSAIIKIGPGAIPQPPTTSQEGTSFQDVRGGQVVQSLNVTRQAMRFENSVYTRWRPFREQMATFLNAALPILAQSTPVHSVGVEYIDFFHAVSEGPEDAGLIIDNQSQLIAKRAFRRRDPFHSHSGWFDADTGISRRLVNVDVTVGDAQGPVGQRRTITIRTFEAEQVSDAASSRALELTLPERVLSTMDDLHVSLKERLGHILTRDARKMISLGS